MESWFPLAVTVMLQVLGDRKNAPKYFAAIAKVYVKIDQMVQLDPRLQAEVEHQRAKTGGR